ncbi:MAG TPA: hypothetical protein DCY07_02915 [Rhodospirillaceae bacterium]|nr:hypothetical protein [Rhodospirillaceae bacterium]
MDEFPVKEYLAILKRRLKLFLVVFSVLFVGALIYAAQFSNYRSTATVEVEASEISSNITSSPGMNMSDMLEALADLRISRTQQKVTSTGSLVEIITKFNLYPAKRAKLPVAAVAKEMREKIKVQLVSSMLANPASANKASAGQLSAIAFTLSFDYSDPLLAQQVTNELVTRFLDEDLKQRRTQAEQTTAFLDEQIKTLEASLIEQEKKIAEYKQESGDMRPEALMFNQQAAAAVSMSLQNIESQIATADGNVSALRAQLSAVDPYSRAFADGQVLASPSLQLKALQTQYATLSAQYGASHPDVVKTRRQIAALKGTVGKTVDLSEINAKITDIETKLTTVQSTSGEKNPDVISLKRQLKNLQAIRDKQRKENGGDDLIKQDADNPAYLNVVSQLRSAEGQRKGLTAQREALMEQQERYRKAVTGNPVVEQQLAALTRDYENSQMRYRELKAKKMAADMGEQLERDRKGQRMSMINPPELPLSTTPRRIMLLAAGFVLAFAGGLATVIGLQLLSQSVRGPLHVQAMLGTAPLTAIPYIRTKAESYRFDRNKRYLIGLAAMIAVLIAAALSLSLMPFGVIWSALTGGFGLSYMSGLES